MFLQFAGQSLGEINSLSIRKIPPDDERDLLLSQLLHGYLQRIRLTLEVDQNRGIHTVRDTVSLATLEHDPSMLRPPTSSKRSLNLPDL